MDIVNTRLVLSIAQVYPLKLRKSSRVNMCDIFYS